MIVSAMLRHAWWSIRGRFLVAGMVVVTHAAILALGFRRVAGGVPSNWELSAADRAQIEALAQVPYDVYLGQTWAGGGLASFLTVIAVALAVGGVAAERRQQTLDLTLSLPARRGGWLIARGALVMALATLLALISAVVVAGIGVAMGHPIPAGTMLGTILLAGVGAAHAAALGLFSTTITRDSVAALLLGLGVLYLLGGVGESASVWAPGGWQDLGRWSAAPPWRSLAAWLGVVVLGAGGAIWRFSRTDV
ncbi:MAG: ABC transporter permease subunit [Gemmatimonadales bacterium]